MTGDCFNVPSSYSDDQLIYYIAEPANRASFGYTNARYKIADTPVWPQNAQVSFTGVTSTGIAVTFPQALDGEEIHHYSLVVKKEQLRSAVTNSGPISTLYLCQRP